jgi:hypothetical protein
MPSPWYAHHYIGEFAGDAAATANVTARGWGPPLPSGLLYFDTGTGTLRYSNGGLWNAIGGGGPAGGHLGIGGGAGGVAYNYEDHNTFNTSWMWRTPFLNMGDLGINDRPDEWYHFNPMNDYIYASRLDGAIYEDNGIQNGNDGGIMRATRHFLPAGFPTVDYHFMAKGVAFGWTSENIPSIAIGFFQYPAGITPVWWALINAGVGFGYDAALMPNPNYYAVVENIAGAIFMKDTGIPILVGVYHKFNVVLHTLSAEFYIDDIPVATITSVEAGAAWPDITFPNYLFPIVGLSNPYMMNAYIVWYLPFISALGKVIPP